MIEGFAREMPESLMAEAIAKAHEYIREICEMQIELAQKVNVVKAVYPFPSRIRSWKRSARSISRRSSRPSGPRASRPGPRPWRPSRSAVKAELIPAGTEDPGPGREVLHGLDEPGVTLAIRELILSGTRPDGRDGKTLRPITCSVDVLPRVHGSAVFQRGETQALVTVTLGTGKDEQRVDGLVDEYAQKFMLHYYFPSFSVGEVRPIRGPGRREIGHGALAERSVKPVLPGPDDFPYTIRIISDILESNGSSSMATRLRRDARPDGRRRADQQPGGRHLDRPGQGSRTAGPC